jgi:hypothetical protein
MKERPILFSGPMIMAIHDGRKTMTRRINTHPRLGGPDDVADIDDIEAALDDCPYGQPGDRLWVRETWRPEIVHSCTDTCDCDDFKITYLADGHVEFFSGYDKRVDPDWCIPKAAKKGNVPSIFMPRWASRILLEITDVKIERVQEISEEDAIAEGVDRNCLDYPNCGSCKTAYDGCKSEYIHYQRGDCDFPAFSAVESFRSLWNSINAKRGFGWESNPWVWANSFKRVDA